MILCVNRIKNVSKSYLKLPFNRLIAMIKIKKYADM